MPEHIVRQGECLSSISASYGCDWQKVWQHPRNEELRRKRETPNIILPGDVIFVPDREDKRESGATEARHRYRAPGVPTTLQLRLMLAGAPIADAPYQLSVDGRLLESGRTDGDGCLEQRIEPGARRGTLLLTNECRRLELDIGGLDPIAELSGIQARLYNLGFDPGPIDGIMGPRTEAAVKNFQATYGLIIDGIPGPQTQGKLREKYGS